MFQNGSIVTLAQAKTHGEGEDAVRLQSGICGMVTRGERKTDNNHRYTVDFGAYGAWYCMHNELLGDDKEGWDTDGQPQARDSVLIFDDILRPDHHEEADDDDPVDELNAILDEDSDDETGEPAPQVALD